MEDLAEGVYNDLTLGTEATFTAEGVGGQLRYDPMSMRLFISYSRGDYAAHRPRILDNVIRAPIFARVNRFQHDPKDGYSLWPGYRDNLRTLLWLMDYQRRCVQGGRAPVGVVLNADELNREGLVISDKDLARLLTIDVERWRQEMGFRREHLARFTNLSEEIEAIRE